MLRVETMVGGASGCHVNIEMKLSMIGCFFGNNNKKKQNCFILEMFWPIIIEENTKHVVLFFQ